MFPVRCTSCGKVLGNLENKIKDLLLEQSYDERNWIYVFKHLNLTGDCCQQELMTCSQFDEWQFYYDMINKIKPLNFNSQKRIKYADEQQKHDDEEEIKKVYIAR